MEKSALTLSASPASRGAWNVGSVPENSASAYKTEEADPRGRVRSLICFGSRGDDNTVRQAASFALAIVVLLLFSYIYDYILIIYIRTKVRRALRFELQKNEPKPLK
jgi:hypothetical protein